MNYIKTTISKADYKQVQPMLGKWVIRVLPIEGDDDTITCVECMVDHEPTKAEIKEIEQSANAYYLPMEQSAKVSEIDAYDKSNAVNELTYQGQPMWIDVDLRVKIQNGLNKCIELGEETYPLWNGNVCYNIPCNQLNVMLAQLEVYAIKCMDNTNRHKANVMELTTIADVQAYDFTTGYPDKLEF